MNKLKCYYAHTMLSYNSTIEQKDVETLEKLGFEVVNPNQEIHQRGCKEYGIKNGNDKIMDYFKNLVVKCDVFAFRTFPDGKIPSGIAAELSAAYLYAIPIIEFPSSIQSRIMEYPETKQYLTELGHYKV